MAAQVLLKGWKQIDDPYWFYVKTRPSFDYGRYNIELLSTIEVGLTAECAKDPQMLFL